MAESVSLLLRCHEGKTKTGGENERERERETTSHQLQRKLQSNFIYMVANSQSEVSQGNRHCRAGLETPCYE